MNGTWLRNQIVSKFIRSGNNDNGKVIHNIAESIIEESGFILEPCDVRAAKISAFVYVHSTEELNDMGLHITRMGNKS